MAWLSQTTDFLSGSFKGHQRYHVPLLAVTTASFTLGFLLCSLLSRKDHGGRLLLAPKPATVSSQSEKEAMELALPPDVLPGARDVPTPYGSIRVYEWGPEDGPKVLFVHGITTPCISLGGVAHSLVDRGCRVMLFDL